MDISRTKGEGVRKVQDEEIDFKKLLKILFVSVAFFELILCICNFFVLVVPSFYNYTIVLCCYEAEIALGIIYQIKKVKSF